MLSKNVVRSINVITEVRFPVSQSLLTVTAMSGVIGSGLEMGLTIPVVVPVRDVKNSIHYEKLNKYYEHIFVDIAKK